MAAKSFPVAMVPVDRLSPYPGNARRGNVERIAESLAAYGQWRPIVAQKSTGHVLVGNHMLQAATSLGWGSLAVYWMDVDDDTARRILLMDNRSSDGALYDDDDLRMLFEALDGDVTATGWSEADMEKLLRDIDESDVNTEPMLPSYQYNVIVECRDEAQQAELLARFEADGLTCKALVT